MSGEFRILVTGSREFDDYEAVYREIGWELTRIMAETGEAYPKVTVVHGAARGADSLAERAAREYRLETEPHPADWKGYGKRAGFIRNAAMVSLGADVVLAFYKQGAGNKGTEHCARQAEAAGIPTRRITA